MAGKKAVPEGQRRQDKGGASNEEQLPWLHLSQDERHMGMQAIEQEQDEPL